jgi:dephospho-CoA kinase
VPVLGLTGGIATGKSTFATLLQRELKLSYFDSDACVHQLLAEDATTRDAVQTAFGGGVLSAGGWPDRAKLREIVFSSKAARLELEAILHPRVRQRWLAVAADARKTDAWQLIDIPLLYETGAQAEFDRVIVVASSHATQIHRLVHERHLASALAEQIIAAQLNICVKIEQADHVIWNDSTVLNLDGQTRILAAWLERRYPRGESNHGISRPSPG